MRTPPTALTNTSWSKQAMPAWRCSTASSIARRSRSRPTRQAPRARPAGVDQRLHLDQQRPRAFERDQHAGARHRLAVRRQEDRARIGDALQAAFGHREHADLVDRAEAVLDRAHQAEAGVRVAFEIEHRVDDVLEHARPGKRAVLGDVADQHDGGAARLGDARELRRALAHLRDRAGRRGQLLASRPSGSSRSRRPPAARPRSSPMIFSSWISASTRTCDAVEPEPARAQRDLRAAFLAGDVERAASGATAHRAPAAAASTCRCPGRRRSARRRPRRCRRRARGRARRCRSAGGRPRRLRSATASRPACADASDLIAMLRRPARPPTRPACSRRRSSGICRATAGWRRRIRCSCRSCSPWPCRTVAARVVRPSGRSEVAVKAERQSVRQRRLRDRPVVDAARFQHIDERDLPSRVEGGADEP